MSSRELPRVLIVDNDEHLLQDLERVLEGEGFATSTCWSAKEALQALEQESFDVVLLDDFLSDMDAAGVLKEIQAMQRPVRVIVTQNGPCTPDEEQQYAALGACAVVAKRPSGRVRELVRQCWHAAGTRPACS